MSSTRDLRQPILYAQAANASKFGGVADHHCRAAGTGMGGNQQIVVPNSLSRSLEL
jgi:hypothetical protein